MAGLFPDPGPNEPLGARLRLATGRLRRARQDAGLSVPELARRLGWAVGLTQAAVAAKLGIGQPLVSRFERGLGSKGDAAMLRRYCRAIGEDTQGHAPCG
jgi:transcriptional regulator with XRE-family HTH domain